MSTIVQAVKPIYTVQNGPGSVDFDNTNSRLGTIFEIDAFNTLDVSAEHAEYESSAGTDTGETCSIDFFHRF